MANILTEQIELEISRRNKLFFNKKEIRKWVDSIRVIKSHKKSLYLGYIEKNNNNLLITFWKDFDLLEDSENKVLKLNLLINYSQIVLKKISFEKLTNKRKRFLENKNYYGMHKAGCRVCGSLRQVIRHQIIQLQNGGSNHFKNLITLCEGCHGIIHEWISTGKHLEDDLSEEYKGIFLVRNHNPSQDEGSKYA